LGREGSVQSADAAVRRLGSMKLAATIIGEATDDIILQPPSMLGPVG
jgi:hypothetical protein